MNVSVSHNAELQAATVWIDRPDKLNALTVEMWQAIARSFEQLSADDGIRVVLLRGASDRAFSVGADIGEFETQRAGKEQAKAYAETIHAGISAVGACPHPVVAAVQGYCVGGGVELAAACDMRIASSDSRFGVPIKLLGLPVDYPELRGLVRLVGPASALEILYEGRVFSAQEALEMRLVNRLIAPEAFEDEVSATTERIAAGAPLVARCHKKMIRDLEYLADLGPEDRAAPFALFDSEDYRIGTRAFLDKSTPKFRGR